MNARAVLLEGVKRPIQSVIRTFWTLDEQVGYPVFGIRENRRTRDRWTQFTRDLQARQQRYRDLAFPTIEHPEVLARDQRDRLPHTRRTGQGPGVLSHPDKLRRRGPAVVRMSGERRRRVR
jgi:hypothetical protein